MSSARPCRMFVCWDPDDPTGDGAATPVPAPSHEEAAHRFAKQRNVARGLAFWQRVSVRVGFGDPQTFNLHPGDLVGPHRPRVTL